VFGIGFGATILVLGLLLRDFAPRLRFRKSRDGSDVLSAEELVAKVSWTRFCTALGSVLALAGAVFLITTLVSMVLVVSDDTGLWVMSIAFGLLLIVVAYWTWAYFHRFGSYGILPERVEPKPALSRPQRRPARDRAVAYAGPPAPPADAAEGEYTEDELDAVEPADEMWAEQAAEGAGETGGEPAEVEGSDASVEAEEMAEPEPRLETPEERLAHAESPIDHGSAEGDLDLAATGPRRPGSRAPKRPDADTDADSTDSSDDTSGEPDDPAGSDDRDRT
jgi:hypothetical protein